MNKTIGVCVLVLCFAFLSRADEGMWLPMHLKRLNYVDMQEDEFSNIADTFRDPRVWWIKNNEWWKDNIWGEPSKYGAIHLS